MANGWQQMCWMETNERDRPVVYVVIVYYDNSNIDGVNDSIWFKRKDAELRSSTLMSLESHHRPDGADVSEREVW